jgi:AcrR family transcriptional regulator
VASIEDELLHIALKEFIAHGYGGTSLARIIKVARISTTTMYARYPSKEDLFRAIVRWHDRRFVENMPESIFRAPLNLAEALEGYANYTLKAVLEGDALEVRRLIHSEARRFPELGAASLDRMRSGVRRIAKLVADCALAEDIPCSDPEAVAETFIVLTSGWAQIIMVGNQTVSDGERARWVKRAVDVLLSSREQW